jgi:peptidoglycan/xylan/chitin deacetylase (PgdA/CDA1 family)
VTRKALDDLSRGSRSLLRAAAKGSSHSIRVAQDLLSRDRLRILAYHDIADRSGSMLDVFSIPHDEFRAQIRLLRRLGFHFVTPRDAVLFVRGRTTLPPRSLLVTFDDGYLSQADAIVDTLAPLNVPSALFVVTREVGGTNTWDQAKGAPRLELLSADALRALGRHDVTIGAHTRTHPALPDLAPTDVEAEVAGSRQDLVDLGFAPPEMLAYPFGRYSTAALDATRDAGYSVALSTESAVARRGTDPFRVPRITVYRTRSEVEFLEQVLWAVPTATTVAP